MEDLYNTGKNRGDVGAPGRLLRLQLPICDRVVMGEVSEEISLPDYQPEIKRLLRVSATVQPPTHYVGGGSMEFGGSVDLCVIYTGNDGQMYCFPTSTEYSVRAPLEASPLFDLNDALVCYAYCEPESVISRVSGPRRMTVKCRLRSHVKAYGSCVLEEKRQGEYRAAQEERLLREAETAVSGYAVGEPMTVSDEILLERDEGGEVDHRLISGEAQVLLHETKCASGRILCRGEVVIKIVLQRETPSSLPTTMLRKVPFEGQIETDAAAINGQAVAWGSCNELSLSMEDGRILCEAEVVLQARTDQSETLSYTADWYATDRPSRCTSERYQLPQVLRRVSTNFTQSEARTLEELGLTPATGVIDVAGVAVIDGVEIERGKYVVSGKCRYSLITAEDGEMGAKEIELPLRYVLDGNAEDVPYTYEGQMQLISARARMDAERLAIDAELGICLCILGEREIDMVSEVSTGEAVERTPGEMTLCYPSAQDTLWSVGKRYGASLDELVRVNRLGGEHRADDAASLSGVRMLVV